jgi:predicted GNAT family acetyltransferase
MDLANNAAQHRYEIADAGQVLGHADYRESAGVITFTHTEIDPSQEGKGLGSQLAKFALDDVRSRKLRVVARCKFIAAWIQRHPEYQDLLQA